MRKIRYLGIVLVLLVGCASVGSNYERAAVGYVEASIAYDAALDLAVALRTNHQLSDEQWTTVDRIQRNVAAAQPKVRALLDLWRVSHEKPKDWDALFTAMLIEITKLQGLKP